TYTILPVLKCCDIFLKRISCRICSTRIGITFMPGRRRLNVCRSLIDRSHDGTRRRIGFIYCMDSFCSEFHETLILGTQNYLFSAISEGLYGKSSCADRLSALPV